MFIFAFLIKMDKAPIIKINNQAVKFEEEEKRNANTLSPGFGKPAESLKKKARKEVGVKSHHDFLIFNSENKNPMGKKVEMQEYTKEEVGNLRMICF